MSALTKASPRSERGSSPGNNFTYWSALPVKGDVKIYNGAMVGILGGLVQPVTQDADMIVLGCYSIATAYPGGNDAPDPHVETFDTTGLEDGAKAIDKIKRGIFRIPISADDPVTIADVGKVVYAEDDNTIALSSGLVDPVNPKAGILYDVVGSFADVVLGELPL